MPEFKPNVPVVQTDPLVEVTIDKTKPMPAGKYKFQLVVVDDAGNESAAATLEVLILDTQKPTAVLDVVNADKVAIKPEVPMGSSFLLSGAQSSDVAPGKIKSYRFTLMPA